MLPSTAESEGYSAEKAKGHVKVLEAGGVWHCEMDAGVLTEGETEEIARAVEGILR